MKNRLSIFVAVIAIAMAFIASSDAISANTKFNPFTKKPDFIGFDNYTVATLPAADSNTGKIVTVTDGLRPGDCTTGAGSTVNLCFSNGIAWTEVGNGAGINKYTVATLPSPSANSGKVALVTDSRWGGDCSSGGGSNYTICFSNGSQWGRIGDGMLTSFKTIGIPGEMGFGVCKYPSATLPSGFTALSGHDDPYSWNYGNYQYADGSIMVWIPKFYYYVTDGTTYPVNTVLIKGTDYFASTAAANAAGYALHRAFIDGGLEKPGFFFDKYKSSKIAIGTGWGAGSIANGNPISTAAAHNPIADLTSSGGTNAYYRAIDAAHARDGVNGAVNAASIFHVPSKFQYAALAMLSLAHAQASSAATPACAWYMAASNFPKGNNNNALADTNDTSVLYTTDGYSNAGKTGSGKPFAKTTHNGQPSGVCDLNGGMYEISLGITAIATTVAIEDLSRANPCVVTWTGHGLATGDYVQVGSTAITDAVWVPLTGKIYKITKVNDNSFSLDGADSSGFASAYVPATDPGTITKGSFYTAKQSVAMKSFTSGNSGATDHWGATGVAAMMDAFVPIFKTAYPNNVWALRMGSGTALVISNATSGAGWLLAGLGFPASVSAIDATGTAQFGADYYYQYIVNELCLISCCYWNNGSAAGVWASSWLYARSYSSDNVGFRAACYPVN